MAVIAPFLRSPGYICALEGLVASGRSPLVFVQGLPHGSKDEIVSQIMYVHERCLQSCVAEQQLRPPLTIVNVRSPTFRFPDAGCLRALMLTGRFFPWLASGRTVFVRAPGPVQWSFEKLKPLLSAEQYEAITFVDGMDDLVSEGLVDAANLPAFLCGSAGRAGSSEWCMEEYIEARCAAEGVAEDGSTRPYTGASIDWAPLDRFDEKQRAKQLRREAQRRRREAARQARIGGARGSVDGGDDGDDESLRTGAEQQDGGEAEATRSSSGASSRDGRSTVGAAPSADSGEEREGDEGASASDDRGTPGWRERWPRRLRLPGFRGVVTPTGRGRRESGAAAAGSAGVMNADASSTSSKE